MTNIKIGIRSHFLNRIKLTNIKKIRIAIVTNVIPSYREGFYDRLCSRQDVSITVFCQESVPGLKLRVIHSKYPSNVHLVKFLSAPGEKLGWRFIPWIKIFTEFDVVFVDGNPRILSDAVLASLLKVFRKKVVLWTMGHSFRSNKVLEQIRLLWTRLFYFILVYTEKEVAYLQRKGFSGKYLVGMNNGLDQKQIDTTILAWPEKRLKEWRLRHKFDNRVLLLSCARLVQKNKFHLFIQALPDIIRKVPNVLWCIIGNGPEQPQLKSMVDLAGLSKYVLFVGELYNEEELAPWFLSSKFFIHPAAIGLSLLHSFGYGLPVVTHGNASLHGPEYAAFEPGLTGYNFDEDEVSEIAANVIRLLADDRVLSKMKQYVQEVVRNNYNVDVMVERFITMARKASGLNESTSIYTK
jgi:glycosyltransferase involved in cell wall biosynthesis